MKNLLEYFNMSKNKYIERARSRFQRTVSAKLSQRPFDIRLDAPFVSFSFDDFPRSAFHEGGDILSHYGLYGTYYTSMGLMGTKAPTGEIFTLDDLKLLHANGHELGCHTFAHCDSWETDPASFQQSIVKNRQELEAVLPGVRFNSLSYPISNPRPNTKKRAAKHYSCCRGGGQAINSGRADMNLLRAFFIEKKRNDVDFIKRLIDLNEKIKGWLIFATHDISRSPTQYGCTPSLFKKIVGHSVNSTATILPVAQAFDNIIKKSN